MSAAAFVLLASATAFGQLGLPAPEVKDANGKPLLQRMIEERGLPFFDIRLDADGVPVPRLRAAIDKAQAGTGAARAAVLAKLKARVVDLTVDFSPFTGTPNSIRSTAQFLTGPSKAPPHPIAADFIAANQELFEIDAGELAKASMTRDFGTDHNGAHHMTFQQQIRGVDLFGCMVVANTTRNGELINIASSMLPRPAGDFVTPPANVSDLDAIRIAATNVGIDITSNPVPEADPSGATRKRAWKSSMEFRAGEAVVTELTYFPVDRETIHPAWSVLIPQKGIGHTYEMIVDATDGTVLYRHNRLVFATTQPITMRVYTSDSPAPGSPAQASPNGFQAPFVPRTLVTITPAQMSPYSPNGWIDDGNTETVGNNVDAHLDLDGTPNSPDLPRPNGGAARIFDFPLDTTQAPSTYRDASVTQLFYLGNLYHDRLYAMGFNEVAKNFQSTNFGLGGAGNDAVQADCQDGGGINNANFGTGGADGTTARCQMYVFTGPTPDRDGSLDADIVYHEFTHGTSIRLHGGLSGTQPQGMGEGWSDFFGICLLAEASDDPDHRNFSTGPYATYQLSGLVDNYYFGIRRYPYSTSFSVNPLTFAHIRTAYALTTPPRSPVIGNSATEVHNVGEVWCNALLECRAALWNTYGFAGNQRMMQLVLDGMKLTAAAPTINPTFLQSRDAIIQADLVNYAGVDQAALWERFAKRGMGFSASTSVSSSTTDVVEAFDIPQRVTFTYPSGQPPTTQAPGVSPTFSITTMPFNLTITPNSGVLHYSVNGGPFLTSPMADGPAANQYVATIPAQSCFSTIRYYVSVDTSAGSRFDPASTTSPTTPPTTFYSSWVISGMNPVFTDDFEIDRGWTTAMTRTTGTTGTLTGLWTRVNPVGTANGSILGQPEDDHTSGAGTNCFVTEQGAVDELYSLHDVDNGTTTLTSPAFSVVGLGETIVSYWRWFANNVGNAASPSNVFLVQISSDNGTNWTTVETIGPSGAGTTGGWIYHEFLLSSFPSLAHTATMKVRFVAADIGGAVVEAAVDDFSVREVVCNTACVADVDDGSATGTPDGGVGVEDLLYYLAIYDSGVIAADVDDGSGTGTHDGGVGIEDLLYFLSRYDQGC
jgi:hypothetical protein